MDDNQAITEAEYSAYYKEIYVAEVSGGPTVSRYRVPLDKDPSIDPMAINRKLSEVQAYKDRLVVILNHAIRNKSHRETILKAFEAKFEDEVNEALTSDSVKNSGNAGIQRAVALRQASKAIETEITEKAKTAGTPITGEVKCGVRLANYHRGLARAVAFLAEVKNLYENLDASSMALALQLKSLLLNARVYGEGGPGFDKGGTNGR